MEKRELVCEGKAKYLYTTDESNRYIAVYKDDGIIFNGLRKGPIVGRGVINNKMSNLLMRMLETQGITTHYVQELSERETLIKKAEMIPLEVVVRNVAAGSFAKRYNVSEGRPLSTATFEISLKDDDLGDPLMSVSHAIALDLATKEELVYIEETAMKINEILKTYFKELNIELIDFKLEFGRFEGEIILADEISPETCRLWDLTTHEKLDKDRLRKDMDGLENAYQEVMHRLLGN